MRKMTKPRDFCTVFQIFLSPPWLKRLKITKKNKNCPKKNLSRTFEIISLGNFIYVNYLLIGIRFVPNDFQFSKANTKKNFIHCTFTV